MYSDDPFFKADRDSGKLTITNQLLGRIRSEKAQIAKERGESVRACRQMVHRSFLLQRSMRGVLFVLPAEFYLP